MSIIKSISVGNGDLFYIKHGSSNFTIIDCNMDETNKKEITDEIIAESKEKDIKRFISTHPDEDHIHGLKYLDDQIGILNFSVLQMKPPKVMRQKILSVIVNSETRRIKPFIFIEGVLVAG